MDMRVKKPKKESRIGLMLLSKTESNYTCIIVVTRGLLSLDGIIVADGDEDQIVSEILSEKMFREISFIVPLTEYSKRLAHLISIRANIAIVSKEEVIDKPYKEILYKGFSKLTYQFMESLLDLRKTRDKIN